MNYSTTEAQMWEAETRVRAKAPTDEQINEKYGKRELRIVTETNREQLPNFVSALNRPNWMNLQPFYQRRRRWDEQRKSKLIESFIMNIPVPPFFLYESEFARYEVMDGQQRISAIWDFYSNRFKLRGLEQWPELNGRIYDKLPSEIKKGLDRRSVSYIVLLKESAATTNDEVLLRQQVFERLNTGGVKLENQEIRHCIYHNEFDNLLLELSHHPAMRRAWRLPAYNAEEDVNPPDELLDSVHYSKMKDAEFVLRFFALRHVEHYRGGMQTFLDQYMVRSRGFTTEDIEHLGQLFVRTIELSETIYGDHLFRPWVVAEERWATLPQIAYADAVMVGLSNYLENGADLSAKARQLVEATKQLIIDQPAGTFTGQRNTKEAVQHRIQAYCAMVDGVLK